MKTILRSMLLKKLTGELKPLGLLAEGKTLLLGVSGGADSVALLHGTALLRETYGFTLAAVHVEHGIRGEESKADGAFVKELCRSMKIPLQYDTVDAPTAAKTLRCGLEEAARILRYQSFEKAMDAYKADALLLAHHGDDQAETVLMHLLRGSGPSGLCGMQLQVPFGGGLLVRPLLSLRHETLVKALLEENLTWREDTTNFEPSGLRNTLRLTVIPSLTDLMPGCIDAIGRTARVMASEEEYLDGEAEKFLLSNARMERGLCFIKREALMKTHPAFIRRVLRVFFESGVKAMAVPQDRGMTNLSYEKTEELMSLINNSCPRAVNLPGNVRGEISEARLFLIYKDADDIIEKQIPVSLDGKTRYDSIVLSARSWHKGENMGDGIRCQALDSRYISYAVLRYRQPGDRFTLPGGKGSQKLKETLIDRHVDRPFRDRLPLLAQGPEILWIPGIGPSGAAEIREDTKSGILFELEGYLPWEITKEQ